MGNCEINAERPIREAVPRLRTVFVYFYAARMHADHLAGPNSVYNITVESRFLMYGH